MKYKKENIKKKKKNILRCFLKIVYVICIYKYVWVKEEYFV